MSPSQVTHIYVRLCTAFVCGGVMGRKLAEVEENAGEKRLGVEQLVCGASDGVRVGERVEVGEQVEPRRHVSGAS